MTPLDLAELERLERELRKEEAARLAVERVCSDMEAELHRLRARNEELRDRVEELRQKHICWGSGGDAQCMLCENPTWNWRVNEPERHAHGCLAAPEGATE